MSHVVYLLFLSSPKTESTIVGVFSSREKAENAAENLELKANEFTFVLAHEIDKVEYFTDYSVTNQV
jgi:hypothetical protein